MEKNDDVSSDISSGTNVKFPISLIAGAMVGIAVAWWSQFEAHKQYDNERFNELQTYINRKAADRYTASQAKQFEESVKQRFNDSQRSNDHNFRSLQRQIDHIEKEINGLGK
jgi:uncharacterized protein HemX